MIRTTFDELSTLLATILQKEGMDQTQATTCAAVFAENTRDGVASHGVNRFVRFITQIRDGVIDIHAQPVRVGGFEAFEQWDGGHGAGPLNALAAVDRAMELARTYGMGTVALRNTTHWMRGATYGWHVASLGFPCICWTNTTANMPPWGTTTNVIGNNPIVFAIPGQPQPFVLDMALSQFSYGKLETLRRTGDQLPYSGGFDRSGELTTDPAEILATKRMLPVGMWKGSGLSIMLDLFASSLSGGSPTVSIPTSEPNVSQLFITFHAGLDAQERQARREMVDSAVRAMQDLCSNAGEHFPFPGEGTLRRRNQSDEDGIYVHPEVYQGILALRG